MVGQGTGFKFKRWQIIFGGVIFVLVAGTHLWHNLGSTTLAEVAALPVDELHSVHVTWGTCVYAIKPERWESLLGMLAQAPEGSFVGQRGDRWGAIVCFELDWGEERRYWVRLQTRERFGDQVIVNMEEPQSLGAFFHKGTYDGNALFRWIMASPPRENGFRHQPGGRGCPPIRGTPPSHLLPGGG